jgi:hypothetical protein
VLVEMHIMEQEPCILEAAPVEPHPPLADLLTAGVAPLARIGGPRVLLCSGETDACVFLISLFRA